MTETGAENKQGKAGLIVMGAILIGAPFALLIAIGIGFFGGNNPTAGATKPEPIAVGKADTQLQMLLKTFSIASDPQDFLKKNSDLLVKYQTNLKLLAEKLQNNDPAYAGIKDKAAALALINTMLGEITSIEQQVGTGATAQTTKLAQDLIANAHKLDQMASSGVVAIALQYAADNAASGYTKYNYSQANRTQLIDNKGGDTDCSSFVSLVMYQAGVTRATISYTTIGLYTTAKAGNAGFTLVMESNSSSGIASDTVRNTVQPGDIILSGNDTYAGGSSPGDAHAVMFVGNNQVVESSSILHNGIYTDTLDNRLHRHTQAIIRPTS